MANTSLPPAFFEEWEGDDKEIENKESEEEVDESDEIENRTSLLKFKVSVFVILALVGTYFLMYSLKRTENQKILEDRISARKRDFQDLIEKWPDVNTEEAAKLNSAAAES